jgi:polyphosphate glucokinase
MKKQNKILVVDVGGTHVKLMISRTQKRKFDSGPRMTPREMVSKIKETVEGWDFEQVSIGFPAPVRGGQITAEPKHLGKGWIKFDFEKALGKPVHVINDAALQALGSYRGKRMLFLGLGTGLGSTLIWGDTVLPLELGELPYRDDRVIEDFLGKSGMEELGEKKWQREVLNAVAQLKKSVIADYVVLGGGNAKKFEKLPKGIEPGHNRNAFLGGVRLWQNEPRTKRPKWRIM